jgi:hypothetical protein
MDRDIFPLCQDAFSEVGKPGYPGGLITRRAVSTFAKLQVAVSSNQPLATLFTIKILVYVYRHPGEKLVHAKIQVQLCRL